MASECVYLSQASFQPSWLPDILSSSICTTIQIRSSNCSVISVMVHKHGVQGLSFIFKIKHSWRRGLACTISVPDHHFTEIYPEISGYCGHQHHLGYQRVCSWLHPSTSSASLLPREELTCLGAALLLLQSPLLWGNSHPLPFSTLPLPRMPLLLFPFLITPFSQYPVDLH